MSEKFLFAEAVVQRCPVNFTKFLRKTFLTRAPPVAASVFDKLPVLLDNFFQFKLS